MPITNDGITGSERRVWINSNPNAGEINNTAWIMDIEGTAEAGPNWNLLLATAEDLGIKNFPTNFMEAVRLLNEKLKRHSHKL